MLHKILFNFAHIASWIYNFQEEKKNSQRLEFEKIYIIWHSRTIHEHPDFLLLSFFPHTHCLSFTILSFSWMIQRNMFWKSIPLLIFFRFPCSFFSLPRIPSSEQYLILWWWWFEIYISPPHIPSVNYLTSDPPAVAVVVVELFFIIIIVTQYWWTQWIER